MIYSKVKPPYLPKVGKLFPTTLLEVLSFGGWSDGVCHSWSKTQSGCTHHMMEFLLLHGLVSAQKICDHCTQLHLSMQILRCWHGRGLQMLWWLSWNGFHQTRILLDRLCLATTHWGLNTPNIVVCPVPWQHSQKGETVVGVKLEQSWLHCRFQQTGEPMHATKFR